MRVSEQLGRIIRERIEADGATFATPSNPLLEADPARADEARRFARPFVRAAIEQLLSDAESDPRLFGSAGMAPDCRIIGDYLRAGEKSQCATILKVIPTDEFAAFRRERGPEMFDVVAWAVVEQLRDEGLTPLGFRMGPGGLLMWVHSREVAEALQGGQL